MILVNPEMEIYELLNVKLDPQTIYCVCSSLNSQESLSPQSVRL